jgi:hypothetical protein
MKLIATLLAWFSTFLRRIGVCGNAGVIVGLLTGGALWFLDFLHEPLVLSDPDALRMWGILALFGWVALLFVFLALVRWPFSSIVIPTLVNAVLVSGITLYGSRALGLFAIAWLLGLLIGALLGFLLCRLYKYSTRRVAP